MENFSPDNSNHDTSSSSIEILDVPKVCPPLLDIASSDSDPNNGKEDACGSTESESSSEAMQDSRLQIPPNLNESSDSESIACSEKITTEKAPNVKASEKDITKKKNTNKSVKVLQKTKSTISEVADRVKTGSTSQLIDIASSDTCGSTGDESSEAVQDSRLQNSSNVTESSDSESITSPEKITNEKEPNVKASGRVIIKKKNPTNKSVKELLKTQSPISEVIDIASSDTDPSNEKENTCDSTESESSSEAVQDSRLQNPSNFIESSDSESISSSEKITDEKKSNVITSEKDITQKKKSTNKSIKELQKTESTIPEIADPVKRRILKSISCSKRRKIERKTKISDSKPNFKKQKKHVCERKKNVNKNLTLQKSDLSNVYRNISNEIPYSERTNDKSDEHSRMNIHKMEPPKHPISENSARSKFFLNKNSSNNALLGKAGKRKKHNVQRNSTKVQEETVKSTENFSEKARNFSKKPKISKTKKYCENKLVLGKSDNNLEMQEPGDKSNMLCGKKMKEGRILQKSKMPKVYQCTSRKMPFLEEEIQRNSVKLQKNTAKSPENFSENTKIISKKIKTSKNNKYCKNRPAFKNCHNNFDTPENENMSKIVCEKNVKENRILPKSKVPEVYQRTSTEMQFSEEANGKSDASDKHTRVKKIHKEEFRKYPVSKNPSKSKSSLNKNCTNNVLVGMTNRKHNLSIQRNPTKKKKKFIESTENFSGKAKNISKKLKISETKKYCKNRLVLQNCDNNSETPEACEKMMNENQISAKSKVLKIYQRTSTEMPLPVDESNKSGASDNNSRVSEIHKTEPPIHRVSAKVSRSKSSLNKNSSNNVLLGMGNRRKNQSIRRNSTKSEKKMANSTENFSGKTKKISNKTNSSKNKKYRKDKLVLENCDNLLDIPETRDTSNNESEFYKTLDQKFPSYRETDDSNYSRNYKIFSNIKTKYKTCPEVRKIISDVSDLPSSENSNVCSEIQYPYHSKRNPSGHLKKFKSKYKAKECKRRKMRLFQEKVHEKKQAQG